MRNRQVNVATPTRGFEAQSTIHENKSEWLVMRAGERCLIRIFAADTNGAYSVVEIVSDSGDGTSMRIHQNEDEHFRGVILTASRPLRRNSVTVKVASYYQVSTRSWFRPASAIPLKKVVSKSGVILHFRLSADMVRSSHAADPVL